MSSATLQWVEKEVDTPYGPVVTLHRAVLEDRQEYGEENEKEISRKEKEEHQSPTATGPLSSHSSPNRPGSLRASSHAFIEEELERSEDLLGSVLWNSITAALYYMDAHHLLTPSFPLHSLSSFAWNFRQADSKKKEKSARQQAGSSSSSSSSVVAPLRGLRILELGAGVGTLGIALAMAGAHVVISDIPELLPLMEKNVQFNTSQIRRRSGGEGHCVAVAWKWGPSMSLNVKKHYQAHLRKNASMAPAPTALEHPVTSSALSHGNGAFKNEKRPCQKRARSPSDGLLEEKEKERQGEVSSMPMRSMTSSCSSSSIGSVTRVGSPLVELWNGISTHHSSPWMETIQCLSLAPPHSSSLEKKEHEETKADATRDVIDYVLLCDALYGNPKDWPSLLFTLSEILLHSLPKRATTIAGSSSGEEEEMGLPIRAPTTIINFCEQRVNAVEKAFLDLLDQENRRPPWRPNRNEDEKEEDWVALQQQLAVLTNNTSTVSASLLQKKKGKEKEALMVPSDPPPPSSSSLSSSLSPAEWYTKAAACLLFRRLREMRGDYVWEYKSTMLEDSDQDDDDEEVKEDTEKMEKKRREMVAKKYQRSELNMPICMTRITWKRRAS